MGGMGYGIRRALAAGAVVAAAASGVSRASAEDVHVARERAQEIADDVTDLGFRLEELDDDRKRLADDIDDINQQAAELELEIDEADDLYEKKADRLEKRAVAAYKSGAGTELAMWLSADDLAEMSTISDALSEAADLDREALDDVVTARGAAERAQGALDDKKQRLMAVSARKDELAADIQDTIATRDEVLEELNAHIAELEKEARAEARAEATAAAPKWHGAAPANPTWGTHNPDRLDGTGPASGIPSGFRSGAISFEGEASWYGPGFEGNTTANGDIFDSSLYTVASKTLPFGTYLYVTYGGRGVVVYVNDRGPYAGDRILDLSHAAAQAIGISGVGWVRAEVIVKTG